MMSVLQRFRHRSRAAWIGIDIGCYSIKLVQLGVIDGQTQILDAAIIPITTSDPLTDESLRSGWLTQALRSEFSRHRSFRGHPAACSLSMQTTEFRSLVVPPGSPEQRGEMIALELSDSHADPKSLEFDYWESEVDPSNPDAVPALNVLAISTDIVTRIAESLHSAHVHCKVLDGAPYVLARAISIVDPQSVSGIPTAVLDWGHQVAHLVIMIDGYPAFSRVLKDCGVGTIIASICHILDISRDECHELLSEHGVISINDDHDHRTEFQEIVSDQFGGIIRKLVAEFEKTITYLTAHRPTLIPESLWLMGGGSTILNIESRLHFETGLPVRRWELPLGSAALAHLDGQPVGLLAQAASLSQLGWGL